MVQMITVLEVVERFLRLTLSWPVGRGRLATLLGVHVLPYFFGVTVVLPLACLGLHSSTMQRVDLVSDAAATSLCFFKLRCMQSHARTLLAARHLLEDHFTALELPVQAEAAAANAHCARRTNRLAKGYVLVYSSLSISGMAIMGLSVLSGDPRDRKLTTRTPEAVLREDYLFWPCLLGIGVELYLFPIATGIFDALFLTLCLHISCKCDILCLLLRHFRSGREGALRAVADVPPSSERGAVTRAQDCVVYHQLIIRLHHMTESIFFRVTLLQTIYILIGVGTPILRITNGTLSDDPYKLTFALAYACWNICQLLTFCWFGDIVAEKTANLSEEASAAFEPSLGTRGRGAGADGVCLHLMILRAQRPLYLTAGRFINLTLRLCLDIMKRSYSLYSALNRLK
ncbi:uncharacterized protein LOC127749061 [Frankliniella occidentalis]|uniref:Odorant receptor n=1 Tax=Frankliniella occidentalis TaxID=133901 RepID=A0A9C6U0V8_FRAOC|nr:uncharacterized protein LOC127749061 [Frankliniella occidentalis]